jgi:WD40 repeat protein
VRVQGAKIVEETNLRAAILNYAEHSTPARQRDGLGIHDVKWSHGQFSTHIATAAANGKVILYDLNRAGIELARLHEHTRQVHKLGFNPHQGHLLLSASHDATVRLWDLRDMRKDIMTCTSRDQYQGINGGIRDVQWSPTDAVEFAFGTDNGTIQRWDFRYNKGPKQKTTAHDQRICTSIDWHPDGKHLLSAGVDKTVKIWDFSIDGRRQKPVFVLTTPYPVYKARWRPPYWSDEHYEKGVYQCTQIATSYDVNHSVIHVWDFRRPYLPFREINKFASAPSDMLWHSRDTLWTVGREGVFQQNDVHLASSVVDRRNLQAFAVSPSGEIAGIAQKRSRRRRPGLDYSSDDTYLGKKRGSPEKTSLRSSADDSLDDSFLTSAVKKNHGRTASTRSAKSFGSTPPSEAAPKVMFLTDSMAMHNESLKPNQVAFRGTLPGVQNVQIFAYLAQKYKAIPLPDPPTVQSFIDLQHVFEQNAEYAQRAAFYRLAETWRIVGMSIAVAARRRAELHSKQRRMQHKSPARIAPIASHKQQITSEPLAARDTQLSVPQNPAVRAVLEAAPESPRGSQQRPSTFTSTSNVPTPLARPLTTSDSSSNDTQQLHRLPDPDHDEQITLPEAVTGPHSSGTQTSSVTSQTSHSSLIPSLTPSRPSFNGPRWYHSTNDLDERKAMIGSWRAPPRVPLSLEPANTSGGININAPPRLDRHDSDESFAMFSASTESQRGTSMPSSYASSKSQSRSMQSIPEKWQHMPVESSFRQSRVAGSGAADRHPLKSVDIDANVHVSPSTILPIGKDDPGQHALSEGVQQGSARDGAGLSVENSSREQAVLDIANLRRNNQLLRHDSSESEALASSKDGASTSPVDYNPDMDASGTIVPDFHEDTRPPPVQKSHPAFQHASESVPPAVGPTAEDALLLSDFQAMHVDAEQGLPFTVTGLLRNVLAFHTDTLSDAQTSSLLLMLLTPLLPQSQSLDEISEFDVRGALAHYSEVITALGLTPTQTETILSTQLTQVLTTGINPFQAEAILHTYHAQLHSLSLFNSAASLRRLAYPTYPAVYEQALKDTQLGLLCLSCKSPINNPKDKMRCETCKRAQAPCPICWGRYPAFEPIAAKKKSKGKLRFSQKDRVHRIKRSSLMSSLSESEVESDYDEPSPSVPEKPSPPKATLWTWCPLCGHGGHTNCMSTWFANSTLSDGACATEGCLCDCVSGSRRDDKVKEILAKKAEKERTKVVRKGDDWKVRESKAVSAVRGSTFPSGDAATAPIRDSAQNQVPAGVPYSGALPSKREDGRRVRVVGPRDER